MKKTIHAIVAAALLAACIAPAFATPGPHPKPNSNKCARGQVQYCIP